MGRSVFSKRETEDLYCGAYDGNDEIVGTSF